MRERTGTFDREAHGRALRHFDWIAPPGSPTEAGEIQRILKDTLDLTPTPGVQCGYVTSAVYADGVHIRVVLYEDCADPACPAGHGSTTHMRIASPDAETLAAMKAAIGEHSTLMLGRGRASDLSALAQLGALPDVVDLLVDMVNNQESVTNAEQAIARVVTEANPGLGDRVLDESRRLREPK